MGKVYIAGPMTGITDFNRQAFHKAAAALSSEGHTVLNPATLPGGLTQPEYMDICFAMVRSADTMFFLQGWENSAGARAEKALAEKLELDIYFQPEMMQESEPEYISMRLGADAGHELQYIPYPLHTLNGGAVWSLFAVEFTDGDNRKFEFHIHATSRDHAACVVHDIRDNARLADGDIIGVYEKGGDRG